MRQDVWQKFLYLEGRLDNWKVFVVRSGSGKVVHVGIGNSTLCGRTENLRIYEIGSGAKPRTVCTRCRDYAYQCEATMDLINRQEHAGAL